MRNKLFVYLHNQTQSVIEIVVVAADDVDFSLLNEKIEWKKIERKIEWKKLNGKKLKGKSDSKKSDE